MAQTKTIQLLRSSQLYVPSGSGSEAKTALENAKAALTKLTGRKDGEIVLARYQETGAKIKSVLGIYHANPDLPSGSTAGWTFIQDVTESQGSVAALQAEIDAIETSVGLGNDGSYTSGYTDDTVAGTPATLKATADNIITYIKGLDKSADAVDGKVVTTVSQADGKVSETKADLTDVKMGGYSKTADTDAIAATDTLEVAVSKLENGIAAATVKSTDKTVKITDNSGKDLSVNIDNTTLVKNETSGVISSALKVIKVIPSGTAGTDEVVDANLSNNVKEAYRLVYDGSTTAIGKQIDIYKDSSLLSVKLLHATDSLKPTYTNGTWTDIDSGSQTEENLALCFAYQLANGTTSVEAVAVGDFLRESEFKDGLVVNSTGEVRVLVDKNSESVITEYGATAAQNVTAPVLSVSSDGVKVSNIQNAIDAAVAHASADLAVTAQGDNYITAAQDATDNKKINVSADVQDLTATAGTPGVYNATTGKQTTAPVAGTLSGVANSLGDAADIATKVKTYVDGAIAIEAARSDAKNVADMKTVSDYTVNGKKISTNPVLDGSDILLTGYTQGTDTTDVVSTDSVNAAIAKLQNQITVVEGVDGSATASSAINVDTTPTADFKVLTKVVQTDSAVVETTVTGGSTAVTLKKLAATGAAADVTVADSGNKLTATNVEDALIEIVDKADASLNSVSSTNGAIAVGTKDSDKNQALTFQVSASCAKQGDGTTNMLTIANDGLVLSDTWDCGVFD